MAEQPSPAKKTTLGMEQNLEGALCYLLGWITGIVFLIVEKDSRFVRFHALQSIATFLPISVLGWIVGFIPYIGAILSPLLWVLGLILWLVLMIEAYMGKEFKLPIAGDFASQQLH